MHDSKYALFRIAVLLHSNMRNVPCVAFDLAAYIACVDHVTGTAHNTFLLMI